MLVCRDLPGDRWLGMGPEQRALAWAALGVRFRELAPPNLLEWAELPAERTEYDEAGRRVRLVVEGVALVPDVQGCVVDRDGRGVEGD